MFLSVYEGQKFSYSYEAETGHYLLVSNDYKTHIYLQGEDARIFREEIERIGNLPPPPNNEINLTENAIGVYL
jgi:hypothetical protein